MPEPGLLYVTLGTEDLEAAGAFYDRTLHALGLARRAADEGSIGYAHPDDIRCRLWVVTPVDGRAASFGNGVTIALSAKRRADVDAFHAAAIAGGGQCEGPPGFRPFHANFYAAFVRDLDGNKIAAVCENAEV